VFERSASLVRPNFISGIAGGISVEDLAAIRSIPGVDIAAPIAMVGFVATAASWIQALPHERAAAYQVTVTSTGDAGESHYPVDDRYLVVEPDGGIRPTDMFKGKGVLMTPHGSLACDQALQCFAPRLCLDETCSQSGASLPGFDIATASYSLYVIQPLVIAGIDPEAEAHLAGLDRCVVQGRYLTARDDPVDLDPTGTTTNLERIPVLRSGRSFVDEALRLEVSRSMNVNSLYQGASPTEIGDWTPTAISERSVQQLYAEYLSSASASTDGDPFPIWTAGDVAYEAIGPKRLRPLTTSSNLNLYVQFQGGVGMNGPDALIPPAARDVAFRAVDVHPDGYPYAQGSPYRLKNFDTVGVYDPECVPGWDPLTGGKLDAYSYPTVTLENGATLTPTRSLSGYINSPPLVLTTLDAAAWLSDPERFQGQPGSRFISAIRIRVTAVTLPGALSEARLAEVASEIHLRTGLDVDVVKGSSPTDISIELPAGQFGRPAHTATEGWSAKGVVIRFVTALDTQASGLLLILILYASVLLATASFISVQRRRREFAVLRALGWSASRLASLIEAEILIVGLASGALVLAASIAGVAILGGASGPKFLTSSVLVVLVAAASGTLPAAFVLRRSPAVALQGRGRVRAAGELRTIASLAWREVMVQSRLETILSVAMLALGSMAIGSIILVGAAFNGHLDVTVLGRYVTARAEPYHLVLAVLIVCLAAIENAQLLTLSYLERRQQFATLRALGWPAGALRQLLAWEALFVATLGCVISGFVVVALGMVAGVLLPTVITAATLGAAAAIFASIIASTAVVWSVGGRPVLEGLVDE
jgi:hypothetical protein